MERVWRVAFYRFLAFVGIIIVLYVPEPFSTTTLTLVEPLLLFTLLTVWTSSYYLRATLATREGALKATMSARRLIPGRAGTADVLWVTVLIASLLFVWFAWSTQPVRIFNATLLGSIWGAVDMVRSLARLRRQPERLEWAMPPRVDEKAQ